MSLSRCTRCGTSCAVGLAACPQCEGTDLVDATTQLAWTCQNPDCRAQWKLHLLECPRCGRTEMKLEEVMARITVGGGVSNADAQPGEPGYITPPEPEPEPAGVATPAEATAEAAPPASQAPAPAARPAAAAPKAAWVDHVVSAGLDRAEAEGMTKEALRAWTPPAPAAVPAELSITADAEVTRGEPQ